MSCNCIPTKIELPIIDYNSISVKYNQIHEEYNHMDLDDDEIKTNFIEKNIMNYGIPINNNFIKDHFQNYAKKHKMTYQQALNDKNARMILNTLK